MLEVQLMLNILENIVSRMVRYLLPIWALHLFHNFLEANWLRRYHMLVLGWGRLCGIIYFIYIPISHYKTHFHSFWQRNWSRSLGRIKRHSRTQRQSPWNCKSHSSSTKQNFKTKISCSNSWFRPNRSLSRWNYWRISSR